MSTQDDKRRPSKKRIFLFLTYFVFLAALAEGVCRVYIMHVFKTPIPSRSEVLYTYYPELEGAVNATIQREDAVIDILFLGGSVLRMQRNRIQRLLREKLGERTGSLVRIHNAAASAHTSRDSLHKYRELSDGEFDLVLYYHNINEVRANNCPDGMFRDDYSHYSWYEEIGAVIDHREMTATAIPFVVEKVFAGLRRHWGRKEYVPKDDPNPEWLGYGSTVKTAGPFEQNVRQVLDMARERGDPMLLMTFAYYVPNNYSFDAFKAKSLDYIRHSIPIELWGIPANVVAGIEAHNGVIRRLARDYPEAHYIDQAALIPKEGKYFNDICHLSPLGCELFVEAIVTGIQVTDSISQRTNAKTPSQVGGRLVGDAGIASD